LINIDAINPDWPRPIHLPDEEETLDKQVSSGAVAARERGLVPQSGDWERPYRWVTPEEVEELEVDEADESESYETVDLVYARENLAPFAEKHNKGTHNEEQLEAILNSDVASVTVWHGTTLGGAKKILEDGKLRGYGGFGAGVTLDPYRAYTYTRGQKSIYDLPDKDKYPVVMQFEIPKDMFQNFVPEVGGKGSDELLFKPWTAATHRSESFVPLPDEYRDSEGKLEYHSNDIPLLLDMDSVKFLTSEDVELPIPEITKPKSSSYEMPKYDLSWDALVESKSGDGSPRFKDIEIQPIPDVSREFLSRAGAVATDNFLLVISPSEIYFGETEEDVKSKMLKEYVAPKGKYVSHYYPPRLTSKPDWATDESDPFPEIPSDIEVIHYDDLPEFYSQKQFGKPSELGNLDDFKGKLKWIIAKANAENDYHSEIFSNAFQFTDDGEDIDYSTSASWIADALNWSKYGSTNIKVTAGEAKSVARQAREQTQKSLIHRGLPEKFYVFRGGPVHAENVAMPTSLSPGAALSFSQKAGKPYIAMYEVNREDVLLDVNSMRLRSGTFKSGEDEHELVIQGRHLKNQRMIQLPNPLIKEPEFRKSKSLDKAVR